MSGAKGCFRLELRRAAPNARVHSFRFVSQNRQTVIHLLRRPCERTLGLRSRSAQLAPVRATHALYGLPAPDALGRGHAPLYGLHRGVLTPCNSGMDAL